MESAKRETTILKRGEFRWKAAGNSSSIGAANGQMEAVICANKPAFLAVA